jgi:aryl-alcohol dehydrogenase-like predicted oxidoreductase
MKMRKLGELEVSAIGLGCMSMSQAYGRPDREESERALARALDVGINFLDTASVYGVGHNETLLGTVLRHRRAEFTLASKCGITVDDQGRRAVDCRPASVKQTCAESLERLQTDVIDLYYLHRRDHEVPIEESVGALAELVAEGKIRHIGLSEVSSVTLRKAHAVHPIAAVQSEYSLWTRNPEHKLLATCRELGVGFVPFSPLGRAFLAGAVRSESDLEKHDMRRGMPRFQGENLERNVALLDAFSSLAANNGCTMAQLALAWVLAQGDTLVPIPGTQHADFVEENAAAAELEISASDLARAGEIINADTIAGERYSKAGMISLDPEP